jgi:hypothetical protein
MKRRHAKKIGKKAHIFLNSYSAFAQQQIVSFRTLRSAIKSLRRRYRRELLSETHVVQDGCLVAIVRT